MKTTSAWVGAIVGTAILISGTTGCTQSDDKNTVKIKSQNQNGVSYTNANTISGLAANTNKEDPLTFVLVHGSWADANFWSNTAAELKKQGHTVYVPEYAGHGTLYNPSVKHEDIVKSVVDYITSKKLKNFVLVGHSFGGTVIQKVAEQVPDRINRLVFFDAFVPLDGQSLSDQLPPELQKVFGQLAEASGNGTITMPFTFFREGFVNTASESLAKSIYKNAKPEPATPLVQKLDLKKFYGLNIPKSYLFLTSDTVTPQGDKYGFHPAQSSHLGQFRLILGEGDHMTTAYEQPGYLAQKLYQAARK
ncbi:alpha/beta hydrolase [Paenibacillus qinlingensis]|uniref:Pimeloyl-ACP methyl ester carboxylesterase n=1 Tax=Paenibacillus qinlingensis TaxID=1837343 RepID=A0ABU1NVH9_9BACL|nr:alpha/beta hydrolase [Paenibacillus qinlingensis]MDR6550997.1 pimeloyl-ACP methyl ester carboxylesterase [Paenibacillus qinlingensis]